MELDTLISLVTFLFIIWVGGRIVADSAHCRNVAMRDTLYRRDRLAELREEYPFHNERDNGTAK